MKPKQLIKLLAVGMAFSYNSHAQTLKDSLMANGYLFDEFKSGTVLLKSGGTQTADLNYNTKDQSFAFRQNGQYMTLTNSAQIDTIYVDDKKFIALDDKFYEVELKDEVSLLSTYTEDKHPLVATTDHNGSSRKDANQVSNTATGVYVSQNPKNYYNVQMKKVFWLVKGSNLYKANTEKEIKNRFPTKSDLINKYIAENNIKVNHVDDMVKLISYCNSLQKL